MGTDSAAFGAYLREHAEDRIDRLVAQIQELGPTYRDVPTANIAASMRTALTSIAEGIETGDDSALTRYARGMTSQRVVDGVAVGEIAGLLSLVRLHTLEHMDDYMTANGELPPAATRRVEDVVHHGISTAMSGIGVALREIQRSLSEQSEQLEAQQRTIRELSTPIVPIHEGVMVLPLVGALDSHRASQVVESVLDQIVVNQADVLIIDITGVPVVDTGVANHLLMMTRAVRLLGAQVVLVGISAEIAQTVTQLGVDLSGIATLANLQTGITYALDQIGYAILPTAGIS